MSQYTQLPEAATLCPIPFHLKVTDEAIDELKLLLKLGKLPPDTFETLQEDGRYGMSNKWMRETIAYWKDEFDW